MSARTDCFDQSSWIGGLNHMWHINCWNISHVTWKWSLTFKVFKLKRGKGNERAANILRHQSSVFPMAWILWNSPACMPKCGKDYEIRKNRSRDLLNTLITLNKMLWSTLQGKLTIQTVSLTIWWPVFLGCLEWIFQNHLVRYVLSYLCGTP